jgi:hypothetical protein
MTDRELLELAAKAAGIEIMFWSGGRDIGAESPVVKPQGLDWNPLTDDGDALRLAVKLRICSGPNLQGDLAVAFHDDSPSMTEPYEPDPYAATRRAITRAAAEIGKAMP